MNSDRATCGGSAWSTQTVQRFYVCVRCRRATKPGVFVCGNGLQVSVEHPLPSAFAMDATPRSERRGAKKYVFLLPLLLAVRLSGYSGDRSRKLSRRGKEDRVVKGVGQHRHHLLGQRKGAGRILETAGSTSDLKGQSTVCLPSREIYAIFSLREIDLQ